MVMEESHMISWDEYLKQLLLNKASIDDICFSFNSEKNALGFPPIIKSSILILDKMIEKQGLHNIIVFPERRQSIFFFTIARLLHNIFEERIAGHYDPSAFEIGEKVKIGKAVAEFQGIEEENEQLKIKILQGGGVLYSAPIELFPYFQKTTTNRRLSRHQTFIEEKNRVEKSINLETNQGLYIKKIAELKTHMENSVYNMTPIINTKQMVANTKLCDVNLEDLILIGQTNYEGEIRNFGRGQLSGTPSIVLASDLYAILEAINNGNPAQSIIIDISNANTIVSQLDVLDRLMEINVPINCLVDTANSFDLKYLRERGFTIWRWDQNTITESLLNPKEELLSIKLQNCASQKIEYIVMKSKEIGAAMTKIMRRRNEVLEQMEAMSKVFQGLYYLTIKAMRRIIPLSTAEINEDTNKLVDYIDILEKEKNFTAPDQLEDYYFIIDMLSKVYYEKYPIEKINKLKDLFLTMTHTNICVIVPNGTEKVLIQNYWKKWMRENGVCINIDVLNPSEFYSADFPIYEAVIVVGWLKRAIMRKILYSYNSSDYYVLLYDCEAKWMQHDTNRWNKVIDYSDNRDVIKHSLSTEVLKVSHSHLDTLSQVHDVSQQEDEQGEIELILRESRYKEYSVSNDESDGNQTVEAVPVNFVGGILTLYRKNHKVVSATEIIKEDGDKIRMLFPQDLKVGDFIVVRDSDKDVIREMADKILENSGKGDLRELATEWKEVLEAEKLFLQTGEICRKIRSAGCERSFATIRTWLIDESMIAPQDENDLAYIAIATKNTTLMDKKNRIFEAAKEVRAAHVQAGRALVIQLRKKIAESLEGFGSIDPFNIWEPIIIDVEGVGIARVMKIIDISEPIKANIKDTNRLISE